MRYSRDAPYTERYPVWLPYRRDLATNHLQANADLRTVQTWLGNHLGVQHALFQTGEQKGIRVDL